MKPSYLALKPSRCLAYALAGASLSACVVLLCMPLFIGVKLALIVGVASVSTYLILRDALFFLPWSWCSMTLNSKDEVILKRNDGLSFIAEIQMDSVVMPFLMVLNVKLNGYYFSRPLIVLKDSAEANEFRRWRVWLKWGLLAKR